ncbi:MAG TPA: hypothetical protein DHW71_00395 [Gammaproteobacteria bacterium]|nr:hypothetical protein [Gammaproteobacteria bacterium]HBF07184.1 hypothetical protein [Gammaproteobacteria bacterium]HCK91408.1 hypothetical protein [Gammaproteobacteria bacterium]
MPRLPSIIQRVIHHNQQKDMQKQVISTMQSSMQKANSPSPSLSTTSVQTMASAATSWVLADIQDSSQQGHAGHKAALQDYFVLDTHARIGQGLRWTAVQNVFGDGKCGWRAAWLALLQNTAPEELGNKLRELGVKEPLVNKMIQAGHDAQHSLQNVLALMKDQESQTLSYKDLRMSPMKFRYASEPRFVDGYTQAEKDLTHILEVLLPKLDANIDPNRIQGLLKSEYAETHEILSFARLLDQELLVNTTNYAEMNAKEGSGLHSYTDESTKPKTMALSDIVSVRYEESEKSEDPTSGHYNMNVPIVTPRSQTAQSKVSRSESVGAVINTA